jgi:PAS domain S-box-containing protein
MLEVYEIYFVLLLLSGFISLNLGIYIWWKCWSEHQVQAARTFAILMMVDAVWAFGCALALFSETPLHTYFWERTKYIGILLVPPTWFIFSLQWVGADKWLTTKRVSLVYITPLICLFLVFTDSFHHLIWSEIEYVPVGHYLGTSVVHGVGWWFLFAYSYLLLLGGTFHLVRGLFTLKNIYRKHVLILLVGCFAPWIANVIYSFNLFPNLNFDFAPTAFIITGLAFTWGFSQFKLLDVVPVAKDAVFENMIDPMFVLDAQSRVVDITPAAQKFLNRKIADAIGKKAEEVLSDQHDFIKHLAKEKEYRSEVCLNKQEQEYCYDMQVTPLYDSHNHFNGRIIVLRDITKRKEAEETLRKSETAYRAIFENTGAATIIVEDDTTISLANHCFEELSRYNRDEIEGKKSWTEFVVDKDLERMEKFHKLRRKTPGAAPTSYEFKFVDKKGNIKDIFLTIGVIPGTKKSVASLLDATKQKMVLNELRDAHEVLFTVNRDLERKVKERTVKIEKLIKQKDEFINQLGHDLKTPLTPMMVLIPIIKEKSENPKNKELLDVLMRNIYYMRDLVTKTIDLAKLNSDKIEFTFEDTNLLSEVKNVLKNNHILFEDNHINVINKIDEDTFIEADKLRLNELFNNLLTNSIKYTPEEGGEIIIDVKKGKDFVTVGVRDTGIGMTSEQIDHIFDEFYKADDSRHNLDSSGLGLSICKRIVEKHGGNIWAESPGKGEGTAFYFTLKKIKKQVDSE